MKINKEENKRLNKMFHIPAWVKGSSPSEELESVKKRFKDRTGKYEADTMQDIIQALADKQEYVKMQHGLATESQQVPDQMHGEIPEGMEQFAHGGSLKQAFGDGGGQGHAEEALGMAAPGGMMDMSSLLGGIGIAEKGIGLLGNIGNELFGDTGIDTSGKMSYEKEQFNPLKPLSILGKGRRNKDITEANYNNALATNLSLTRAYGGYTDPTDPKKKDKRNQKSIDNMNNAMNSIGLLPDLEYGSLDPSYFNVHKQGVNYAISPTASNPQNPQGFNTQMKGLQGLNPNAVFDSNYLQFQNRNAHGGYMNQYAYGGKKYAHGGKK